MDITKGRIRLKSRYISGLKGSSSGYTIIMLLYRNIKRGLFQPKWLVRSTILESELEKKDKSFNNILKQIREHY